ncbi:amino acid adenylation domain-containing protein [Amycolatopsis sp. GA6-003]|uniref:amino acid adenylation domain-containing protein n=1 Tax=Amycolatopsis sp. GA6-003 TaxID=2652444 RepID=UPI003917225C
MKRLLSGRATPVQRRIPNTEPGVPVRLSDVQERIWLTAQLADGLPIFHLVMVASVPFRLDSAQVEEVMGRIVRRHDSLRMSVRVAGGVPWMSVADEVSVRVPATDLSREPDPEAAALALADEIGRRSYRLAEAPLWRLEILRTAEDSSMLVLGVHHMIADAASLDLLVRELANPDEAGELPVSYRDFAAWQRSTLDSGGFETDLRFWKEELEGVPHSLGLPTDRPRPAAVDFSGNTVEFDLASPTADRMREQCKRSGVTFYVLGLAAFGVLLSRYTHRRDLLVGTFLAGRSEPELHGLVGMFVTMLPVRIRMTGAVTFAGLLDRVREATVGVFSHQGVPFGELVREFGCGTDRNEPPLVQAAFNLLRPAESERGTVVDLPISRDASQLDLTVHLVERPDGGFRLLLEYQTALFDQDTMTALGGQYLALLDHLLDTPHLPVRDLAVVTGAQRAALTARPKETTEVTLLVDEIARQVRENPAAVAIEAGEHKLTYGRLDELTGVLAAKLRAAGAGPEQTAVGVCLERGLALAVALLAVWRVGAAYLPLDPEHPRRRWADMLAAAKPSVILTDDALAPALSEVSGADLLTLAADGSLPEEGLVPVPWTGSDPDGTACLLFTSGSTGGPKGVVVTNAGIANRVLWTARRHGLRPGDRMLQKTRIGFDAAGLELFAPLASGATVVMSAPGTERDPAAMLRAVSTAGITVLQVVPSVLRLLAEQKGWEGCTALRLLFSAGEPLDAALCRRVLELASPVIWNTYGPTECSIDATAHEFDGSPDSGTVPIGKAIDNVRVLVADQDLNLTPATVPGELLIGGIGLARGYLGAPELTAERFVPDPYGPPGSRLYRTGDVVRRGKTGELSFVGRADEQSKINGVRVEPSEVSAALLTHPAVTGSCVVADGPARLVAYLVFAPGTTPEVPDLRAHVADRLPRAMIPASFVAVDSLPLNENGKIDRFALPSVAGEARSAPKYRPPCTTAELLVADVWSRLLDVKRVGLDDDFFALGGHSLLVPRLAAALSEAAGVQVAVTDLFGALTVAAQATLLAVDAPHGAVTPIRPIERVDGGALPLSWGQRQLWFLDQLTPGSPEYVLPIVLPFSERVEIPVLEAALTALTERHEILRMRYELREGEPCAVAGPVVPVPVHVVEGPLQDLVHAVGGRIAEGVRLDAGPCHAAVLLRRTDGGDVLVLVTHHIAADGLSVPVVQRDLRELYRACLSGEPAMLPALTVQYADFAAWQTNARSRAELEGQLAFWRRELAGMTYLEMPADRPRPPLRDGRGAVVGFTVPRQVAGPLVDAGRVRGATPFMTLFALFAVLLGRYARQRDIAVGSPTAGRSAPGVADLVGFFVNTVVLRVDLSGDPTIGELIERARATLLGAFANQDVPFEMIVDDLRPERDLSRAPLVPVLFDVTEDTGESELALDGRFAELWQAAKCDQTWTLRARPDGSYVGTVEYAIALFDEETVRAMTDHFVRLLESAADVSRSLSTLNILNDQEREDLSTHEAAGECEAVPAMVFGQADLTPDAPAVYEARAGGRSVSYRELADHAEWLAQHLVDKGVKPGDAVAVVLPRGVGLVAAVLAVWRAGAIVLPLEMTDPPSRWARHCAAAGARTALVSGAVPGLPVESLVDVGSSPYPTRTRGASFTGFAYDGAAYIMFTSGSAGRPKGVLVGHAAIANRVRWSVTAQGLSKADRILHKTRMSFDAALVELFVPLAAGGTVVVPEPDAETDPAAMLETAARTGVSVLQLVPSVLRLLLELPDWPELPSLRQVWLAGEPLTHELVAALRARADVTVWNTYGPTECAVDVTARLVDPAVSAGPVPIGTALPGLQPWVLGQDGELVPAGVPGELCVGGAGLAMGYADRPDLTAERFLPDPYGPPGGRVYRTGDLVRWHEGELVFIGRVDDQIKVNGVRVEPAEVEAVLASHPGVLEAVVTARAAGEGKVLAACYRPAGSELDAAELGRHCRALLPAAMIPGSFTVVGSFPLTANGKLDRAAVSLLAAPERPAAGVAPSNPVEKTIAGIWTKLLGVGEPDVHTSFFAVGGNSLLAIRLVGALRREFDIEVPVRQVFEGATIAGLAVTVERIIRQEVESMSEAELYQEFGEG